MYASVEVCDNMTYGSGCASSCGKCSNGETCHFVDGSCPHGCAEGATGDKCQYSMTIFSRCAFRCLIVFTLLKKAGIFNYICDKK